MHRIRHSIPRAGQCVFTYHGLELLSKKARDDIESNLLSVIAYRDLKKRRQQQRLMNELQQHENLDELAHGLVHIGAPTLRSRSETADWSISAAIFDSRRRCASRERLHIVRARFQTPLSTQTRSTR